MSDHALLIAIVIIDAVSSLSGVILALYLHHRDSAQQEAYRDEEMELLNVIADGLSEEILDEQSQSN